MSLRSSSEFNRRPRSARSAPSRCANPFDTAPGNRVAASAAGSIDLTIASVLVRSKGEVEFRTDIPAPVSPDGDVGEPLLVGNHCDQRNVGSEVVFDTDRSGID